MKNAKQVAEIRIPLSPEHSVEGRARNFCPLCCLRHADGLKYEVKPFAEYPQVFRMIVLHTNFQELHVVLGIFDVFRHLGFAIATGFPFFSHENRIDLAGAVKDAVLNGLLRHGVTLM